MHDERPKIRVVEHAELRRYEIFVDGVMAGFATYRIEDNQMVIRHTEVFPEFEHQGLANELAGEVLDDIRHRDLRVVPQCPFFAKYVRENPEYNDLVIEAAI